MAYCGCATRRNRVGWSIVCCAALAASALFCACVGIATNVFNTYQNCMDEGLANHTITQDEYNTFYLGSGAAADPNRPFGETGIPAIDKCEEQLSDELNPAFQVTSWLLLAALLVVVLPCIMMCFFSEAPPPQPPTPPSQALVVQGIPVAPPFQVIGTPVYGLEGAPDVCVEGVAVPQ